MPWRKQQPAVVARYNAMVWSIQRDGSGDWDVRVYWQGDEQGSPKLVPDGGEVKLSSQLTPQQVQQFQRALKKCADAVLALRGFAEV